MTEPTIKRGPGRPPKNPVITDEMHAELAKTVPPAMPDIAETLPALLETNSSKVETPEAITLPSLMSELSIIGDILSKRHKNAMVGLRYSPSSTGFYIFSEYSTAEGKLNRYTSRKITDSLTPKGLAMVIEEVKSGVGI